MHGDKTVIVHSKFSIARKISKIWRCSFCRTFKIISYITKSFIIIKHLSNICGV